VEVGEAIILENLPFSIVHSDALQLVVFLVLKDNLELLLKLKVALLPRFDQFNDCTFSWRELTSTNKLEYELLLSSLDFFDLQKNLFYCSEK
jgi:hypothetical protein